MDDIESDNLDDRPVEEEETGEKQIPIGGTKVL